MPMEGLASAPSSVEERSWGQIPTSGRLGRYVVGITTKDYLVCHLPNSREETLHGSEDAAERIKRILVVVEASNRIGKNVGRRNHDSTDTRSGLLRI